MATKSDYKAVLNFFRNTMKLSQEELRGIVASVIDEIVRDECRRYFETTAFEARLGRALGNDSRYGHLETELRKLLMKACESVMKDFIERRVSLNVDLKSESAS